MHERQMPVAPGIEWSSAGLQEWPDAGSHIIIALESATLRPRLLETHPLLQGVRLMYSFLPGLCGPEAQTSHSLPATSTDSPLTFNFCTVLERCHASF